jgi:hypothetical protein
MSLRRRDPALRSPLMALGSVYLAARFSRRAELNEYREELEGLGVKVTSRWLTDPTPDLTDEAWRELATKDVDDVRRADGLVLFADAAGAGGGGRHVEFGIAMGLGKPTFVVGDLENLFQRLPTVTVVGSWSDARDRIVS